MPNKCVFVMTVPGTPIPQGRPKVTVRGRVPHVYYSKLSTQYRKKLVDEFVKEWAWARGQRNPIENISFLSIGVHGMRSNADPDNMLKQVCDALVEAGVIAGDTRKHLPIVQIACFDKSETCGSFLLVEIYKEVQVP